MDYSNINLHKNLIYFADRTQHIQSVVFQTNRL